MKTTDREVLRWTAHYLRSVRAQFTGDAWETTEPAAAELLAAVEKQLAGPPAAPAPWAPMPEIRPVAGELATLHPICPACGKLIDEDGGCHC